jgi:hypothetical protein
VLGVAVAAAPASVPGLTRPAMTMSKMAERHSSTASNDPTTAPAARAGVPHTGRESRGSKL